MQKKEKNKIKDTNHPRLLKQYSHGEMTSWGGEACLIGFKIIYKKGKEGEKGIWWGWGEKGRKGEREGEREEEEKLPPAPS